MTTNNAQTPPSHSRGSRVTVSELPIIQRDDRLLIDARLLHQKLQSKQEFANWIKNRIKDYGFTESEDFLINLSKTPPTLGGRPKNDYLLTLDMAKEIAMLERNEVGRQIRRYFIRKEKEATLRPRNESSILDHLLEIWSGKVTTLTLNNHWYYHFMGFAKNLRSIKNPEARMYHYIKAYPNCFVCVNGEWFADRSILQYLIDNKKVENTRESLKRISPALPFSKKMNRQIKGGAL